jgi:long-subunit acyl-CoA synthetase (AMP-forming)
MREYAGHAPAIHERANDDPHILKFSGGSTGAPKTVVQSLRCINAQADGIFDFFEFRDDDVNLIAAPLTHGASCFVLPIFEAGGRHVLLEDANPAAILDTIDREGVTTIYAPPTMLYGMLGAVRDGRKFPTLRHVIYSAAPMSAERIRECQRVFGNVIETAYGQVEAPQIITAMRAHELLDERNLTSVGRPSTVASVRIASADGDCAKEGESGEILVAGPLLMTEYLGQRSLTHQTIVDGWLHTGDIGHLDAKGRIVITDRKKDMIVNDKGDNVAPQKVEGMLTLQPEIAQAMVSGDKRPYLVGLVVPDAEWALEWAKANGEKFDFKALQDLPAFRTAVRAAVDRTNKDLSVIEKVRQFAFADEPFTTDNEEMTPSLKIRRHKIRERYGARMDGLYKG